MSLVIDIVLETRGEWVSLVIDIVLETQGEWVSLVIDIVLETQGEWVSLVIGELTLSLTFTSAPLSSSNLHVSMRPC